MKTIAIKISLNAAVFAALCAIVANMYFIYGSAHMSSLLIANERETYEMRNDMLRISSSVAVKDDINEIAVSHLIIEKPLSVSISR